MGNIGDQLRFQPFAFHPLLHGCIHPALNVIDIFRVFFESPMHPLRFDWSMKITGRHTPCPPIDPVKLEHCSENHRNLKQLVDQKSGHLKGIIVLCPGDHDPFHQSKYSKYPAAFPHQRYIFRSGRKRLSACFHNMIQDRPLPECTRFHPDSNAHHIQDQQKAHEDSVQDGPQNNKSEGRIAYVSGKNVSCGKSENDHAADCSCEYKKRKPVRPADPDLFGSFLSACCRNQKTQTQKKQNHRQNRHRNKPLIYRPDDLCDVSSLDEKVIIFHQWILYSVKNPEIFQRNQTFVFNLYVPAFVFVAHIVSRRVGPPCLQEVI